MKVVIVGGGVAGLTLACLLEQRGVKPLIIERVADFSQAGYMLGLWPLGYRVLHGLSLHRAFAQQTVAVNHYQVRDDRGRLIKEWSLEPVTRRFGPNLSCTRPQLIQVLRQGLRDSTIKFNTSVREIHQDQQCVNVTLTDGSQERCDALIGSDGMHSNVRDLVFGSSSRFDTQWGGWVWWVDHTTHAKPTYIEHWGAGRFVGGYPTTTGTGVFAAAPRGSDFSEDGHGRRQRMKDHLSGMGSTVDAWLETMPDDQFRMYFWDMADQRAEQWVNGRVVLVGDAAAGFLPTAGIGASMAMESAAVLADELSRSDADSIPLALSLYERRRRQRVERIQNDSRRLGKMMFVRSRFLTRLRNCATKFYSIRQFARSTAKAFEEPI